MKAPLKVIEEFGCPTSSYIAAIQHLCRQDAPKLEYEERIQNIIGLTERPECSSWFEARVLFMYVVQETIREFSRGISMSIVDTLMEDVYKLATERAYAYIEANPWNETRFNIEHGLRVDKDEHGNEGEIATKKGAKKEISEQLFKDLKAAGASRQKIIDAFIEQVGMSRAGATTYFHALKKEFGFSEREQTEQEPQKAESKQEMAERLYNDSADKTKVTIISLFTEKLGTSKLGAQTYYYACKKKYENKNGSVLHIAN